MEPKVSIVVPVYNTQEYLKKCIDSLLEQTYKNIEIICVNDGSTDQSGEILHRYAATDNRIFVIDKVNTGVSDTRNKALEYITGEYLMFLDSDDWLDKETCSTAVHSILKYGADVVIWNYTREFENESRDKIIFGKEQIIFNDINVTNLHRRFVGLYGDELFRPENADSIVPVWGKLYRTSMIKKSKAKFIDTSIIGSSEDALFNLQVFGHVKKAVYIASCFSHYRKENCNSFTKIYKKNLETQWKRLFGYIKNYIDTNNCDATFYVALDNRIALSIVGLGMNILCAEGYLKRYRELRKLITSDYYQKAIEKLELKYFRIHWKLLFFCAKHRLSIPVYIALICMKIIKER